MTASKSSGLNAGYVGQLLEQYLENPEAVDPAWRSVFERGDDDRPRGAARASSGSWEVASPSRRRNGDRRCVADVAPVPTRAPVAAGSPLAAAPPPPPAQAADDELAAAASRGGDVAREGVSACTATSHARLDPLGSEPLGDPALDETASRSRR